MKNNNYRKNKLVGIGGMKCLCCRPGKKPKILLNRWFRRTFKIDYEE